MAGLYIHIPFCRSKCYYCDFYSRPDTSRGIDYIDAIIGEWDMRRNEISLPIETIYLGGGTPSLLPINLLEKLVNSLNRHIDINALTEFTIEANPEDISNNTIEQWRQCGINRISIGIQSFDSLELETIGRKHDTQSAYDALKTLNDSNINYNADLIYGLPGQNIRSWQKNLKTLLQFHPPHFSAYLLSYEPGTRLFAMKEKGRISEASEELACMMYDTLCQLAHQNGYHHYEISNFSVTGKEAKHNSAYWNYTPYIGLGVAAHSFDGKIRRFNNINLSKYISTIKSGNTYFCVDNESETNRFNDYIITSLRTDSGFSPEIATRYFGNNLVSEFYNNVRRLQNLPFPKGISQTNRIINHNSNGNLSIPEELWLHSDAILRELIL